MPTVPGSGAGFVAAALMNGPGNFARKEAEAQNRLGFLNALNQMTQQQAAQKQAEEMDLANRFTAISNAPLLGPDKQRLNDSIQEIKNSVKARIKNEYGGDAAKWLEQGEGLNLAADLQRLKNSEAYTNGIANATTYELAISDANQGKMLRTTAYQVRDPNSPTGYAEKKGTVQDMLSDYNNGLVPKLRYFGAVSIPKDFGKEFDNTFYTGDQLVEVGGKQYKATRYGLIDPKTNKLAGAVPVSVSDLRGDWMARGGSSSDFAEYLANVGQNNGFKYKADNYDDYLRGLEQTKIQQQNADTSRMNAANTARHQRAMEANARENTSLRRQSLEQQKRIADTVAADPVSLMFNSKDAKATTISQANAGLHPNLVTGKDGYADFQKDASGKLVRHNTTEIQAVKAPTGPLSDAMKNLVNADRFYAEGGYKYKLRNFSTVDNIFAKVNDQIEVGEGDIDFSNVFSIVTPNGSQMMGVMAYPQGEKYQKGVFIPITNDPALRQLSISRGQQKTISEATRAFDPNE